MIFFLLENFCWGRRLCLLWSLMAICCTLSWQRNFDWKVLGLASFLREPSEMMETFVLCSDNIQRVKKYVWKYFVRMTYDYLCDILLILNLRSKGSAVPSTNVARLPCVGWVCCWLSPLLWEVFLRDTRFSSLHKNQHFEIPVRSGISYTKNDTVDVLPANRYLFLFIHHLISRGWEVIINAMSINDNQRYCLCLGTDH